MSNLRRSFFIRKMSGTTKSGKEGDSGDMRWPNLLLIGDSLTEYGFSESGRWVSVLANSLAGRCDVINRGVSGYTSATILRFLPDLVESHIVDNNLATLVCLGTNDSNNEGELQHVPLQDYKANMIAICDYLESRGVKRDRIVLIPPPPCFDEDWRLHLVEKFGKPLSVSPKTQARAKVYHDACLELARERGCMRVEGVWEALACQADMFCDGIHLSAKGSQALAELVIRTLDPVTKDLPHVCPYWRDLLA